MRCRTSEDMSVGSPNKDARKRELGLVGTGLDSRRVIRVQQKGAKSCPTPYVRAHLRPQQMMRDIIS
jgi:hypothetical protein